MKALLSFLMLILLFPPQPLSAGDVESFNSRLFDLQYFTRPFERAAVAGGAWEGAEGSAASILQNPAALALVHKPELLTYWTFNHLNGQTYALKRVIPPGPGHPKVERICERPTARLSDMGVYQAFRLESVPGTFGIGADALWNDLGDNDLSRIEQSGFRVGLSWGVPLGDDLSVGYGLTYLDDTWHWDVTWAKFSPGIPVPQNVDYLLKSSASSWRHRFGLRGNVGSSFRYGLEADLGHGSTDNEWNGRDTGGDNAMHHYGIRIGLEYSLSSKAVLAVEGEWHETSIEFGRHSPDIGRDDAVAKWDTSVIRPMLGFKYSVTDAWQLLAGYRYSRFNTVDLCTHGADTDYGTFSLGTAFSLFHKRLSIRWNLEYSMVDPDGEIMNLLSLNAVF
ncbi:MAG TPA: hypothetical protein PLM79_12615 [Syntrophobacteraceae bacterium]|nr:hypothetical protein [Syntrophobacteraceae bacterium]